MTQRGKQVDGAEGVKGARAGIQMIRRFDDDRIAYASVEGGSFPFPKAGDAGVIAIGEQAAIVRNNESENSVSFESRLLDRLVDMTHGPVQSHHHMTVKDGFRLSFETIAAVKRNMGHGVGQIEEKSLIGMSPDEINSFFGVPGGEHFLMFFLDRVDRDGSIFPVLQRPLSPIVRIFGVVEPHIIGIHQSGRFVKSTVMGSSAWLIADVPFSETGGGIAVFLTYFPHRGIISAQSRILGGKGAK